jgi:uncharacterized linocin/CFP29 family protein
MATAPGTTADATKSSRGKDQIHWPEGVWSALDHATTHELHKARVAAKFLHQVHVHKKETTIPSDVVIVPPAPVGPRGAVPPDALSIDEAGVTRINEISVLTKLSVAQVEAESHHEETMAGHPAGTAHPNDATPPHPQDPMAKGDHHGAGDGAHHHMAPTHHRATSGTSLAMRAANLLAQAEDLIIFNGSNGFTNAPLFTSQTVQILDPNAAANLDAGLLNISAAGAINPNINANQVIRVRPTVPGAVGPPVVLPLYRENTLNAVAQGISILQGNGHYEHYALVLHTYPYADLHSALPNTLIEPVEPISHLVKAGVYGTGCLPPFNPAGAGLPVTDTAGAAIAGVLYTGVLMCLTGNTMDLVRGRMENNLDAVVAFNQKDVGEQYRFRTSERFAFRLKNTTAFVLLLFMTV